MTILSLLGLRESPLLPVSDAIPMTARHTPEEVHAGRVRWRSGGGSLARVVLRNMRPAPWILPRDLSSWGGIRSARGKEVMVTPAWISFLPAEGLRGSQEQSSAIQTKTPRALTLRRGAFLRADREATEGMGNPSFGWSQSIAYDSVR